MLFLKTTSKQARSPTSTATTPCAPCHHVVKALVVEAAKKQALRGLDDGDRDVPDSDEDHHLVHRRDARQEESQDGRDACCVCGGKDLC